MKTYRELQEVMSMTDMNKVKGGTDHQRKIAQDRQRAREAKNKGFDPKKPVLNDKPNSTPEPKKDVSSAITKTNVPVNKGGSLAKVEPKALPSSDTQKRKPDLRKSQLGKWSQGIQSNPSAITKSSSKGGSLTTTEKEPEAPKPEKKPVETVHRYVPRSQKPDKEVGKGVVDNIKKKKPGFRDGLASELSPPSRNKMGKNLGKAIKSVPGKATRLAKKGLNLAKKGVAMGKPGEIGSAASGDLEGLYGRNKGLTS